MRRRRPPRQVSRELNVTEDDFTFPKPEIWGARVSKSGPAVAPSNRAPREMPRARPPHTTRPWARPHDNCAARPWGARGLLSRHAPIFVALHATPHGAWPRAPARPSCARRALQTRPRNNCSHAFCDKARPRSHGTTRKMRSRPNVCPRPKGFRSDCYSMCTKHCCLTQSALEFMHRKQ